MLQTDAGIPLSAVVKAKYSTHAGRRGGCIHARAKALASGMDPARIREYLYHHFRWHMEEGEIMELYSETMGRTEALTVTQRM